MNSNLVVAAILSLALVWCACSSEENGAANGNSTGGSAATLNGGSAGSMAGAAGSAGSGGLHSGGSSGSGGAAYSPKTLRVYVAGESIEHRNRFVEPPFSSSGELNERNGGDLRNDSEEYGWAIPFWDRLKLRDSSLSLEFVGSDVWSDADDYPYSGTYPSNTPEHTSAISGTSIPSWLEYNRAELENKTFCYDLAFASRGGNDFGNDNDQEYENQLIELIVLLANGSSCQVHPIIAVTAHLPDDQRDFSTSDEEYIQLQVHRFVERTQSAIAKVHSENPDIAVRFVDMYTPFLENKVTTAFTNETWSTNGIIDFAKISRTNDPMHPRRLASIFAGEIAADTLDLDELHSLP